MAQTIIGVDLGTYSVKLVQVERGFGEFKLVNFFEMPLVAEAVLSPYQAASAALIKFFQDNPLTYDYCAMALPGSVVAFRNLELPFVSTKKIDQTVEFELESLIPLEVDQVLFDYTLLSTQEQTSKVLATYLYEPEFQRFLQEIQASEVDPRYVGVDTLDLTRLGRLSTLPPEGRYLLLDIGHTKTNLVIMEGAQLKLARCISWGGKQVTEAIAKAKNLSYEQAEEWKHSAECSLQEGGDVEILRAAFVGLLRQIKQTLFSFYDSGESPIEAAYLFGGTSKTPGIEAFFSNFLKVQVGLLDVFDEQWNRLPDAEAARAVIPNALAIALHGVQPSKGVRINFRSGVYAYRKDFQELGGSLKKLGVMAAVVAGIGLAYFSLSYWSLSSQVDQLNREVVKVIQTSVTDLPKNEIRTPKSAISILNGKITALDDRLRKMQGESAMSSLKVLKTISTALPARGDLTLDIDDVNIAPQRVRLEGRTVSYEGVDKVKSAMEKIKEFKNVQTANVRKGVKDEIKFSVSFDLASETETTAAANP